MKSVVQTPSVGQVASKGSRRVPSGLRLVLLGVALSVVLFSVGVALQRPSSPQNVAASSLVGGPAPAVSAVTLSGQAFNLSQLRGRYVLVNFFASWCVPCRAETRAFQSFISHVDKTTLGSRITIVGVTVNDRLINTKSFVASSGITWPIIYDASGVIGLGWGVGSPPQTFLVAPNGIVVTRIVGQVTESGLMSLLNLAYNTYG